MPASMDSHEALSELVRIRFVDTGLIGAAARVAELAKATLPGAAEVSVTLIRNGRAHTPAFTGPLAIDLDETQYKHGHGPCLEAADENATVHVPFMVFENRWPAFTQRAVDKGAHSSLSIGMPLIDDLRGAINIYGSSPNAFAEQVDAARTFAGFAAAFLANASAHDRAVALAQQLHDAMTNRAVIEQAKGMIMCDRRCTADEAFAILSKLSQDTNRRLRDVAAGMVDQATGNHGA